MNKYKYKGSCHDDKSCIFINYTVSNKGQTGKGFNIRVMCTNLDTWISLLLTAPLSFDLVIAKVCFSTELSFYFCLFIRISVV